MRGRTCRCRIWGTNENLGLVLLLAIPIGLLIGLNIVGVLVGSEVAEFFELFHLTA